MTELDKKVVFPSEHLVVLRELISSLPYLSVAFGNLQQFRLVVDANIVLADLIWRAKHRTNPSATTALQEVVASGTVVAYAPLQLREQVEKHFSRIAAEEQISEELLHIEWRSYQACLVFCQSEFDPNVKVVNPDRDPDDLPFIYLAAKVGAAGVLTRDKDISAMGAPTVPVAIVLQLRDYARGKAVELSIEVGGTVIVAGVGVGAIKLAADLATTLARGFARLPDAAKILIVLATAFAILHPTSRRALVETGRKAWSNICLIAEHLEPMLSDMAKTCYAEHEKAVRSWEAASQSLPTRQKAALRTHAYAACQAARRPLTLQELERKVRLGGYRPRGRNSVAYLSKVLRRDGRFVRCADGCWTVIG